MPHAAVAALLARKLGGGEWQVAPPMSGRAYAALPLPVPTDLPVHLHGRWEMATDRNALAPEDSLPRHEWNLRLSGRVAAAAYAQLIRSLAAGDVRLQVPLTTDQRADAVKAIMPSALNPRGVFAAAARGTYSLLSEPQAPAWRVFRMHGRASAGEQAVRVLHTTTGGWAAVEECLFIHGVEDGGARGAESSGCTVEVIEVLTRAGCVLVDAPARCFAGLADATETSGRRRPRQLLPQSAREWLQDEGGVGLITWLGGLDASAQRRACRCLLAYILSDVDTRNASPTDARCRPGGGFRRTGSGSRVDLVRAGSRRRTVSSRLRSA